MTLESKACPEPLASGICVPNPGADLVFPSADPRCLRKASPVTLSDPPCCAHSPRPWRSLSCRPKWTVTSRAPCRCVSAHSHAQGRLAPCWGPSTPHLCSRSPVSHCASPSLQPFFFPVDANCNGVFQHRPVSPSSLLDTAISEEARLGPGLEEEQEAQEPLPGSTGRRHTLAEVSTHFSPVTPPCKCP